jgi:galactose mutarotase-like enzyme
MDISLASFRGINLVYHTCNGETHPSFFEPENLGWLRTFAGGLLTTCGLTYLGSPVNDNGEELGLHGRYTAIPARQVADLSQWLGDEYHFKLRGIIEEGHMFGNKLRLEREITTVMGQNSLHISDKVTNFGYKPSPFTILYHMNIGYPLLSEEAELIIDPEETSPRDDAAMLSMGSFRKFSCPQKDYREQVFDHKMRPDKEGKASVTLNNFKLGTALTIRFNTGTLPYLVQWKMMGQGEYVLGLEPSNIPGKNRKILREENILPILQPGESISNNIEIVLEDTCQIH